MRCEGHHYVLVSSRRNLFVFKCPQCEEHVSRDNDWVEQIFVNFYADLLERAFANSNN